MPRCKWCKDSNAFADCGKWGLEPDGACPQCFGVAKGEVQAIGSGLHNDYVEDYARILLLLKDKNRCQALLQGFNRDLDHLINSNPASYRDPAKHAADPLYIKLSRALDHFESMCWFPTLHLLPLGILSADDFLHYIRLGCVLKDYGAGIKHGEFTHRLQWHIIMRANTATFTGANPAAQGWKKTPLDLYTTLGKPAANQNGGLWGFLLDRPGPGDSYHHPDRLHRDTLANANAPVLVQNLSRRDAKRRDEFVRDYKRSLETEMIDVRGLNRPASHEEFYSFERQSNKLLQDQWSNMNDATSMALMRAAPTEAASRQVGVTFSQEYDRFKKTVYNRATEEAAEKYTTSKGGRYVGDVLLRGGVQKLSGEPVHNVAAVDQLVAQSYGKFRHEFA